MQATFLGSKMNGRGAMIELRPVVKGADLMLTCLEDGPDYGRQFRGCVSRVWTNVVALNGRKFPLFCDAILIPSADAWDAHAAKWSESAANIQTV